MLLHYITWDVDPVIFNLGPLSVRWYGALFSGAFLISYIWLIKLFKQEKVDIKILDGMTNNQ